MFHRFLKKRGAIRLVFAPLTLLVSCVIWSTGQVNPQKSTNAQPELFNRCWDYRTVPSLSIVPAVEPSAVYFVDNENRLLSVDPGNAERIWASELGGEVVSNLFLSDSSILVVTNSQTTDGISIPKTVLRSISRSTGITEWRSDIKTSSSAWIGGYPTTIVAVGSSGSLTALSRADGKVIWEKAVGAPVSTSPEFSQNAVVFGIENNEILEVSVSDGGSRTFWKADRTPTALLVAPSGRLIVGDERGNVIALDSDGNRSWTFRNGAKISSLLMNDSDYLASSNDNFIYMLSRGGNVKWKRRLPGRLVNEPLLLGDVGVMSVTGGGGVYVVDLKRGKISNRIEMSDETSLTIAASTDGKSFVVLGPAGVVYFSREKCGSK
jgi:outer membrane protein assembly factor BamB